MKLSTAMICIAMSAWLASCQNKSPTQACLECGQIVSIAPHTIPGDASPAAAIAGAIIGGALGHQIGDGSGRKAATAVGLIGGAIAGTEIRRQQTSQTVFRVVVEMQNGEQIELTRSDRGGFAAGDRVIVRGRELFPMNS